MRIQTKLLKNYIKLLIKPYKTLSVIFGSNGSVEKSGRRKRNLDTMDIDEIRKRERVCKNCQICISKRFLKTRTHNTVSC